MFLKFDPRRLDDSSVELIGDLAERSMMHSAPALARWLVAFSQGEHFRRVSERDGVPREPSLPDLPITQWRDTDVAEAMVALSFLTFMKLDSELARFCDAGYKLARGESFRRLVRR